MTRLISFICIIFFFLLLSLIFALFSSPAPPPHVFVEDRGKKLWFRKRFCLWRIKRFSGGEKKNLYRGLYQHFTSQGARPQHRGACPRLFGIFHHPPVILSWVITLKWMSVANLWWADGGASLRKGFCCLGGLFLVIPSFFCGWKPGGSIMMQIWHLFYLWEWRGQGCLDF